MYSLVLVLASITASPTCGTACKASVEAQVCHSDCCSTPCCSVRCCHPVAARARYAAARTRCAIATVVHNTASRTRCAVSRLRHAVANRPRLLPLRRCR